ncbi:coatomer subunit beta'-3-like [Solanum dulcamara]|uniref:coatomer subunit beta'-3-like n=1 Tax=Solanum dulcamara TaxID=45834 RepID=UPI0024854F6F|nr:coatomer subunit beta'-3-like [Solanum dulcamara]
MTFAIEIEKKHVQKSERVKSLEIHPTEPWILVGLYTGTVQRWNYQSQTVEKNYQVSESPVRSAKFIAREKSIIVGSDDHFIRVYNYTTDEKTKEFKAHDDYIRSLAVHPILPYVLSCSDDMMIKLWDWEKDWACTQVFKGHNHYVMKVVFNPKENQTFTSVSLDCSMKMWNLSSSDPILELEAHSKGINCVDFLTCDDKQWLITGSDDYTAKVWDLQTQICVQILEGHKNNISALAVHPALPALFTGSEDGTFSVWDATNYRLLNTQISELGRVWAIGFTRLEGSHMLILGCDEGMIMGKIVCSESTPEED